MVKLCNFRGYPFHRHSPLIPLPFLFRNYFSLNQVNGKWAADNCNALWQFEIANIDGSFIYLSSRRQLQHQLSRGFPLCLTPSPSPLAVISCPLWNYPVQIFVNSYSKKDREREKEKQLQRQMNMKMRILHTACVCVCVSLVAVDCLFLPCRPFMACKWKVSENIKAEQMRSKMRVCYGYGPRWVTKVNEFKREYHCYDDTPTLPSLSLSQPQNCWPSWISLGNL